MDALAMLSDGEEEDEDDEDENEDTASGAGSATASADAAGGGSSDTAPAKLDFKSLRNAGYSSSSLCDTEMYQRLGAPAAPAAAAASACAAQDDSAGASASAAAAAEAAQTAASAARAAKEREAEEMRLALEKAKQRDRKRAGVGGRENPHETNRQKNARKMKMGQASFSLKDDRDCVNPFVDNSTASHVQGYSGKRVDKRASVKQISNLSFTS
eukprot:TRINITY_DN26031_c0_g2_i1.p1 TRINITY_DN26031_c0_g2~~TRINITY_DN26031_c0_g2_i1.p1  ORF type:complete len:214 (+),score=67.20 TRINITY_DN26031_c0_g2_i1:78-719(+)